MIKTKLVILLTALCVLVAGCTTSPPTQKQEPAQEDCEQAFGDVLMQKKKKKKKKVDTDDC